MNIIANIADYLEGRTTRQFNQILMLIIGIVCIVMFSLIYIMHNRSVQLERNIKNIKTRRIEIALLQDQFETLRTEHTEIMALLDENVSINGLIQEFATKENLTYQTDYEPVITDLAGNDIFQEVSLVVTFSQLNTKRLTALLQDLTQVKEIFIKELKIIKEKDKKITTIFTFATLRRKQISELA